MYKQIKPKIHVFLRNLDKIKFLWPIEWIKITDCVCWFLGPVAVCCRRHTPLALRGPLKKNGEKGLIFFIKCGYFEYMVIGLSKQLCIVMAKWNVTDRPGLFLSKVWDSSEHVLGIIVTYHYQFYSILVRFAGDVHSKGTLAPESQQLFIYCHTIPWNFLRGWKSV